MNLLVSFMAACALSQEESTEIDKTIQYDDENLISICQCSAEQIDTSLKHENVYEKLTEVAAIFTLIDQEEAVGSLINFMPTVNKFVRSSTVYKQFEISPSTIDYE